MTDTDNTDLQSILSWRIAIEMPDGWLYEIPVRPIAVNRAEHYADEFGGDVERSLQEDTLPLFQSHPYEITAWAADQMNWSDVAHYAARVREVTKPADMEEGWLSNEKRIVK